jgi:DNA-binding SARP family transcriptional activator
VVGLELKLLRGFDLVIEGARISLPAGAQRVLSFLAIHDRPLQRTFIAGSLWIDAPDERSSGNLRSALWRIRRSGFLLVETDGDRLGLSREVLVDVRQSSELAQSILSGASDFNPAVVRVEELTSDILPDSYEEWILVERERFRQLRLRALERLCEQLVRIGELGQAVAAGMAAVAGEPTRESAQRALIGAHIAEGNWIEAIGQYKSYRRLVETELGLEPSPRMEELVARLHIAPGWAADA